MNDDGPHNHYAARFTRQWLDHIATQEARERIYGVNQYSTGRSRFYIPGWAGFAGLLGAAIGATVAHKYDISSMTGAISGAAIGFLFLLAIGFFFKGISLGWLGVKTALGTLTGIGGGLVTSSAFGGLPRAIARGGFFGGVLGTGLALWLNEPMGDAALRVASFGAVIGGGWRLIRLTISALKRNEQPR